MEDRINHWIVGVTGASGICYAKKLILALINSGVKIDLILSQAALLVAKEEHNEVKTASLQGVAKWLTEDKVNKGLVKLFSNNNISASCASGSALRSGMVICPCSVNTLSSIACGVSSNLIQRAADVTLKERRKLILVPRETPLSAIHLKNMLSLSQLGAVILPACPGFYSKPTVLEDIVDFVVMKILDQMGISNSLSFRWEKEEAKTSSLKALKPIK
ncbi:MAG: UbiX family flavin prenyltransferase [Candidatus Dadabacteria bacterium]|nr:MAG: UbiX family flavin prenyltransferase [Candidatus Dadabacteria bacterium]